MPEVRRGEVTLHYVDQGAGCPVLLIPGHTLDHRMWDDVAELLAAESLRVIRPDLRGHGRSSRPEVGYHWSHHAADMAAVLEAAGVERATVVGFSLGGGVALEMAVTMPDAVAQLALIATVLPDRPFEDAFLDNLKQVARIARTEGIGAAMEGPWMDSPLFAASFETEGVRERVAEIVGEFPGADYLASERDRVERGWTMPERLAEIRAPTLIMVGAREMEGFRQFALEAAHAIPQALLATVPEVGHLIPLEAPEIVARELFRLVRVGEQGGGVPEEIHFIQ